MVGVRLEVEMGEEGVRLRLLVREGEGVSGWGSCWASGWSWMSLTEPVEEAEEEG